MPRLPAEVEANYFLERELDMVRLLSEPPKPVPWMIKPFAVPGTVTLLVAPAGLGKTWLVHEAANAVVMNQRGPFDAVEPAAALLIDAEMGEWQVQNRFYGRYSTAIRVFDVPGVNLGSVEHRDQLYQLLMAAGRPLFVGIDSLRRTTTGLDENDSAMAAVVGWIQTVARMTGAAIVLIHHTGWEGKRARGSSAIVDQVDAAWVMAPQELAGRRVIKVSCTGLGSKPPRYCKPPDPIYIEIDPEAGGVQRVDHRDLELQNADEIKERILAALPHSVKKTILEKCGFDESNRRARSAFQELVDDGVISKNGSGIWEYVEGGPSIA